MSAVLIIVAILLLLLVLFLIKRDKINAILQTIIDEATTPWEIKVGALREAERRPPRLCSRATCLTSCT